MTIDRSSWWWRQGRAALAIATSLLLAGWVSAPLQDAAWQPVRDSQPGLNLHDLGDSVGQGLVLGVLGGFRSIMADFIWIQSYSDWELQDQPQTEATIQLATTLDPREMMFWEEGSRKIAYDMPYWNITEGTDTPEQEAARNHEMAIKGLDLLDRGLTFNPGNLRLLIAKAQIYDRLSRYYDGKGDNPLKQADEAKSAEQYLIATQVPGSPYYIARIYEQTLSNMGREQEAYDYLRKLYPTLPANDPAADKDTIWARLRELEDTLNLPPDQRLPESEATPPTKTDEPTAAAVPAKT